MQNPMNPYGGVNPLIDKMIGNAYDIIKYVARYLREIRYVAENMQTVYLAANGNRVFLEGTLVDPDTTMNVSLPEGVTASEIRGIDVVAYSSTNDSVYISGETTFSYMVEDDGVFISVTGGGSIPELLTATYHITIQLATS